MDMNEYRPNSHKYKEEQKAAPAAKNIQKVVKGPVKVKKKNELQKFADTFITEDLSKVKEYAIQDVLIPGIKKAIWEIFTNGLDTILYHGDSRGRRNSASNKISYASYYHNSGVRHSDNVRTPISRSTYTYDTVAFSSRGEAEDVLFQMKEIVATYKMVSVADFYDLIGVTGTNTDNKYGWTDNIHNAFIDRNRDGYIIKFPRALPID